MLKHLRVHGSDYECGLQLGRLMRTNIAHRLDENAPISLLRRCKDDLQSVDAACSRRHPRHVEALRGMAEGAGVDYWQLLLLNAAELIEAKSGCTSIARVENGQALLVHNEDGWSGEERRDDCALVTFAQEGLTFHAFVYAGELPGNAYGWNSHGLYHCVDYLEPLDLPLSLSRAPRFFTARELLEAQDLSDAVRRLEAAEDASGFHYYIGHGGRILSVEMGAGRVSVREVAGLDIHTNHYLHPAFAKEAPDSKNSRKRLTRAEQLLGNGVQPLEVAADRKGAPDAICTLRGENGRTLSTAVFSSRERTVTLYKPHTLEQEYAFRLVCGPLGVSVSPPEAGR